MSKEELIRRICEGYCSFYKPEKDEEISCRGFFVLQKLLEMRHEVPEEVENVHIEIKTEDDLFNIMCRKCPFFAGDCDFATWKRGEIKSATRESVAPCGGFIFLGLCIDHGNIDIQTIDRVIQ